MTIRKRNWFVWISLIVLAQICIQVINYRNIDIRYPIVYDGGDVMGVYYYAKTIDKYGITLENPSTGGPNGSNMYDYPYSDSLSFALVKIIGLFSDNPFLIINIFYFLCIIITTITASIVIRKRCKSFVLSGVMGILYANAPFVQQRFSHMWLIPFFLIPFECDLALDILDNNIIEDGIPIYKNKRFLLGIGLSFLCAFTGLYYAFFACALFAIAMVIRMLMTGKMKNNFYPVIYICSTIIGCVFNNIPNIFYYMRNGLNPESEVSVREMGDCEVYGLKLIQLLLPRSFHRIKLLADIRQKYNTNFPLVNENNTSALGIVAAIGLVIALCWLFTNKISKTKSYLVVGVFLVSTIGGIGSLLSLFVSNPMRCYNRMSLVIMFLALMCISEKLEEIMIGIPKVASFLIMISVLLIGIFDQTITIQRCDYSMIDHQKEFIKSIENKMNNDDLVFELPYVNWPSQGNYRLFIGYLFSDNLRWSYGAMEGREEAKWQNSTALQTLPEMIDSVWEHGYKGIYLDIVAYEGVYGEGTAQKVIYEIKSLLGDDYLISMDETLYFWGLEEYINDYKENEDAA